MKRMIKVLGLVLTLVFTTLTSFTQDIKGFTFQVNTYATPSDGYEEIHRTNQLYNVSLVDGFAVHNVVNSGGLVIESQFYKIKSHETIDTDLEIIIKFTLLSGMTGLEYTYNLIISKSDEYIVLTSDDDVVYGGNATKIKTYKQ
jgi:hypothetical protein